MWADEAEDDERGGLRRLGRIALGFVAIGAAAALLFALLHDQKISGHHAVTTVTRILLPPPPPPPKPPEPEKVVEQPKIDEPKIVEKQPDKPPPKPIQAPPRSPLTAEAGTGSNSYGLQVGNGSGDVIGGGGGNGSQNWRLYAGVVQTEVQGALRRDDKTRYGSWHVAVRIWLGPSGAVTRAEIASSSGNPSLDMAVAGVLKDLALREAPPAGMPQPIDLRIAATP